MLFSLVLIHILSCSSSVVSVSKPIHQRSNDESQRKHCKTYRSESKSHHDRHSSSDLELHVGLIGLRIGWWFLSLLFWSRWNLLLFSLWVFIWRFVSKKWDEFVRSDMTMTCGANLPHICAVVQPIVNAGPTEHVAAWSCNRIFWFIYTYCTLK